MKNEYKSLFFCSKVAPTVAPQHLEQDVLVEFDERENSLLLCKITKTHP